MYVQMTGYSWFSHHSDPRFRVAITPDELQYVENVLSSSPVIAWDYETNGLAWWKGKRPCGVGFSVRPPGEDIKSFYIPYRHLTARLQCEPDKAIALQKRFLEDPNVWIVGHNIKFDEHMAKREGLSIVGPRIDTMIEARLFREDYTAALKERGVLDLQNGEAKHHAELLDLDILRLSKSHGMGKKEYLNLFGYSELDPYLAGTYGAHDTFLTLSLREFYEAKGVRSYYGKSPRGPQFWGIWDIEMALTEVLCDLEEVGIPVDVEYIHKMRTHLLEEREYAEVQFFKESGLEWFRLGSDDELRQVLQKTKGVSLEKRTAKGNIAVDDEVLKKASKHVDYIKWVSRWRDCNKLATTYTDGYLAFLDENNVLHGNMQQVGTNTGRLSCTEPNLQNIPSKVDTKFLKERLGFSDEKVALCVENETVKRIFQVQRHPLDPFRQAAIGYGEVQGDEFVRSLLDYSQVELRVLAHYTQDARLLKTYLEDGDIHDEVEQAVFGTGKSIDPVTGEQKDGENRRKAKVINFGLSYCMSPIGFARQVPQVTEEEAQMYFDEYNVKFPGVRQFRETFWAFILRNGCVFDNMFGRTRHVPGIKSVDRKERERNKRQAIATLIQGTAAEFTKQSMVFCWRWLRDNGYRTRITNTVHDEIQFDGPTEEFSEVVPAMKTIMEAFPDMSVPIKVDVEATTTTWADKQKVQQV